MNPTVKVDYQGSLRNQITNLTNGVTVVTDGPKSSGGIGEQSSPADLFVASFTACAMTIMALRAEATGADFLGCYAETAKEVDMQNFCVTKITIHFHLKAAFSPEVRAEVERASREVCIVGRSLNANLVQDLQFIYV